MLAYSSYLANRHVAQGMVEGEVKHRGENQRNRDIVESPARTVGKGTSKTAHARLEKMSKHHGADEASNSPTPSCNARVRHDVWCHLWHLATAN